LSIAVKAVRGAAWTIATTVGSRAIGTVATLVLTYFLSPEVIGEVGLAYVMTLTAHYVSNPGVDRFVVAFPRSGRDVAFHATALHIATGVVALGVVLVLGEPLAPLFDATLVVSFLPGMTLAVLFERVGQMPEKILTRDMRFRAIGLIRTAANIGFAGAAIGLAAADFGGHSLVIANVVRSVVQMVLFIMAVDTRDWLLPCRLRWQTYRKLLKFGVPLSIGSMANMASRDWDDLLIASIFGTATLGNYRLAYRLADVPATEIGETIGDVLLPSFANMDEDQRRRALIRSTSLLTLLMAPMAVGLGLVAHTLVAALLPAEWQGIAPLLTVLSAMSIVRPLGWTIGVYLQSRDMTGWIMALEFGKVIALLGAVAVFARVDILWACAGIGVAFGIHSVACLWVVDRYDGVSFKQQIAGLVGPILACAPMAGAVLGARYGVLAIAPQVPLLGLLAIEITVGAVAYVLSALVLAPRASKDFIELLRNALTKAKGEQPSGGGDGNQLGSRGVGPGDA